MDLGLDATTLLIGLGIFLARVADVSIGTVRTISTVQGRSTLAFFLGLVEISLWLAVISTVITQITDSPVLGVFYAVGFSTGNVAGIRLERKLAFGHLILRVITPGRGKRMAKRIRDEGYAVTTFDGEGATGPVTLLYVVCRRRDLRRLTALVEQVHPDAFWLTEQAGSVSRVHRPYMTQRTGWRARFKRK